MGGDERGGGGGGKRGDLDIQDAGGISPVADDGAQHEGGADGDQLKVAFLAGLPCRLLSCNLHPTAASHLKTGDVSIAVAASTIVIVIRDPALQECTARIALIELTCCAQCKSKRLDRHIQNKHDHSQNAHLEAAVNHQPDCASSLLSQCVLTIAKV